MTLWRISNHLALDGGRGLSASGRWHTRGRRIVYCAPNPATALLEVLVHAALAPQDIPVTFRFLEIDAPDSVTADTADLAALGPNWRENSDATRRTGDQWLRDRRACLLRVPSVIVPATWNVLLNPRHPDSPLVTIVRVHNHHIDPRLLRSDPRAAD